MLKKLVLSIFGCNLNESLIREVSIIIVDNDALKSAESVVNELKGKHAAKYEISYFSYPVQGLSNVRNELLKNGIKQNPDFLIFVDDDEYVTPDWLNELVGTIIINNGDMTMGPVNSVVSKKIPGYISCWLDRADYVNNSRLNFIRTGNLIIRLKSLLERSIWFDPRFNKTGGEDSYFGHQMIKAGAKVYWASNAVAFETVPDNRANIKWISKRYYNAANKFAFRLKIEKNSSKILKKILISLVNIIIGFCALVLTPFPFKKRYWGLLKIAEGSGGIAGFLSIRYEEYK